MHIKGTAVIWVVLGIVIVVAAVLYFSSQKMNMPIDQVDSVGSPQATAGTYEPYAQEKLALAETGNVVLYFHADWCPICRAIEGEINADPSRIPAGTHILKVNYDTATDLKQKYGVTYQHTFVQVDAQGTILAKWGNETTLTGVLARIR